MNEVLRRCLIAGALVGVATGMAGCSNDSPAPAPQAVQVQGKLVQGPINGGVVFADKVDPTTGKNNFVQDVGEVSATTAADGTFTLTIPPGYGDYVLVSKPGIGTDTVTGQPPLQLVAPPPTSSATPQVISPLTTVVALTPAGSDRNALIAKINATGTNYNADISTSATVSGLLLAKSIETTVAALNTIIDPNNTKLNDSEVADIQAKTMAALGNQLKSASSLNDTTVLATSVNTAVTSAITAITTDHSTISVSNVSTVSTAVTNAVSSVATTIQNAIVATGASSGSTVSEASVISNATQSAIQSAVSSQTSTAQSAVTVTPTPLTAGVTSSSTKFPVDGAVNVVFSRLIDQSTLNTSTALINGVTATLSFDASTRTLTIKPTGNLAYSTAYTVTLTAGIKDLNGIPLLAITFNFTTAAPSVTGSTGSGSGGTGTNF